MGDRDEQVTEQENLEGTEERTEDTAEVEAHIFMGAEQKHGVGQKHGPEQKH